MNPYTVAGAALLGVTLMFAPSSAVNAIPVYDGANHMQAVRQYLQMTAQLTQLKNQYQQQLREYDALTGGRDAGSLFNESSEQRMRQTLPVSWSDALRVLENGGLPGNAEDVAKAASRFAKNLGIDESGKTLFPAADGQNPEALAYTANTSATAATAGIGQAAFDQSRQRMQRVGDYLERINNTPDLKASMDLNARLLAELNESMVQMIQLQSTQMQLLSSSNAAVLQGRARDIHFTPYAVETLP